MTFSKQCDYQRVQRQKAGGRKWDPKGNFVFGISLCLSFRMRKLRISWYADSKESMERKMVNIQENERVMN